MRIAYFDCFNGAAGDMILGALVDAGLGADGLREELAKLRLDDFALEIGKTKKQGFAATQVVVKTTAPASHRHLRHIVEILDRAALSDTVRDRAKKVFRRLAEAEAAVHNTQIESVHFHEVGAVDAIVDVVGTVAGLERLGVQRIECSPVPVGSGTVTSDHGVLPVPAPATAALLRGVPLAASDEPGELTTPTAAALLSTLVERFGSLPAMTVSSVGYGAGTREGKTRPNLLRVLIGDAAAAPQGDEVTILEANIDDSTGQAVAYACERLLAEGALDVSTTAIQMKKSRPGVRISVIATPASADKLEEVLFAETTTFGVRRTTCRRATLERSLEPVQTCYGVIRMKVGRRGGRVVIASPEYEDCAAAARAKRVPLREVMSEARHVWRTGISGHA